MAQALDPVCGMTVDTETARQQSEYNGTTYYFCSPGCKKSFDADPTAYLGQDQSGGHDHSSHEGHDHSGHSH